MATLGPRAVCVALSEMIFSPQTDGPPSVDRAAGLRMNQRSARV